MVKIDMARLNLNIPRTEETKNPNLGRVVVFCEGSTETNYFSYFASIVEGNKNKYSHLDIVPVNAEGNAQAVLNFANEYVSVDKNDRYLKHYKKYLVFDCDSPDDIQRVIRDMKSVNRYELLPSNLLFETWLLMHFEEIDTPLRKRVTYIKMKEALHLEQYGSAEKSSMGIIRQIIGDGASVRLAIENAKKMQKKWDDLDYTIEVNILEINPYTAVYTLVEDILLELQKHK
jgi:hypothetical protein